MPCSSQRRGGYTIRCSGNWDFPAPEDDYDAARPWATYRTLAVSAADSPITLEVPAGTTLTYDADKVDGSNSSPAFITSYSGTLTVTGGGTLHAEGDNAYTILTDGHNVDAGHWVYSSNLTLQGVTIEVLGGKNESAALPAIAAVHGTGTIVADGVTFRVVDEGCDLADFGPWAPIGDGPRGENTQIGVFCGTFDGGGHTIRNLVCERNLDNHGAGFFGLVRGATIQDLTLAGNSALSNSLDAAGIVAIVDAGGKTTLSGLVNQTAAVSGACPGGIVGRVYGDETLIADCRNEGPIAIAADGKGGGIASIIRHATTLTGCANAGAVSGGIAG